MAVNSVDTSGFNSLFAASTRLGLKAVDANVPSQSERNLKSSNRSLSREITSLNTENKLLSKENQQLTLDNKELSQELIKTQAQKTQDLYEKNNLQSSDRSENVDDSSEQVATERPSVDISFESIPQSPPISYNASTELASGSSPGDLIRLST